MHSVLQQWLTPRVQRWTRSLQGWRRCARLSGRLELKPAINGAFLVDDSYNANPSSLKAGLDALRGFSGKRWLVLGDMLELATAPMSFMPK